MIKWTDYLVNANACKEGIYWARKYKAPAAAWNNCDNVGWLIWLATELCENPAELCGSDNGKLAVALSKALGTTSGVVFGVGQNLSLYYNGTTNIYDKAHEIRAALPVPTVNDLRELSKGNRPWKVIK